MSSNISLRSRMTHFGAGSGPIRLAALLASTAISVGVAAPADAQTTTAKASAEPANVEEVVVTGSNIQRNGFEAPTPTTVVGIQELQQQPRVDIADTLNTMPVFRNSIQPQTGIGNLNGGFGGVNALNLRGLGTNRTLTLLDGMRSVAATSDGFVDVSEFPQELVSRVDVVTGGASAAYGSDAVSGVVNFILDRKFTGLKAEVSGGMTQYADDENIKASVSGGFEFAGGRGHVLLSGEASYRDGILYPTNRDWMKAGCLNVQNGAFTATNGEPQYYNSCGVNLTVQVPGGIIVSGPLRGVTFGEHGAPRNFIYGTLGLNNLMVGGESNHNLVKVGSLDPRGDRQSLFSRFSYDVTENTNVFVQLQWARSTNLSGLSYPFNNGLTIRAQENPFVPAEIAARAAAAGVTTFPLGVTLLDLHNHDTLKQFGADNSRTTQRIVVGADGTFSAFNTEWKWNLGYQKGITRTSENIVNNVNVPRLNLAVDAVRVTSQNVGTSGLVIGQIVCRSTLTAPTNGCIPYNPMGLNNNSQQAVDYIIGSSHRNQKIQLDSVRGAINGEPFSTWAGPVSVATGFEARKEQISGSSDPVSQQLGWFTSNYLPTIGKYDVVEGFLETVAPLAQDQAWAKLLEVNGAARLTHYSNSGTEFTWKLGISYEPTDFLRFRTTYSKDIRAPNLGELYAGGSSSASPNTRDPNLGNIVYAAPTLRRSNPDLVPETAYTFGLGAIFQPTFIQGFSASVDFWNINVTNGIGTIGPQNIIDYCFSYGDPIYCDLVARSPTRLPGESIGRILSVTDRPFNIATQRRQGVDFEASYRLPLDRFLSDAPGALTFRGLATRYISSYGNTGVGVATQGVGANPAKWVYNASVTFANDPLRLTLTGYGFSAGKWSNTAVGCVSACPVSTTANPTIRDNTRPGAIFFDLTGSYGFREGWEVFGSVQNLMNKDPHPTVGTGNQSGGIPTFDDRWSMLGRTYRLGMRVKM